MTQPAPSASQQVLAALKEARAKLEVYEKAKYEPIAIIGLGCRFPGANSPAEYWQLLRNGVDAVGDIPADRWDIEAFYDPNPEAEGKVYTRQGGFLNVPVAHFDPHFFGIAPREADGMDPQQRLLLEVSWEALENAGQAADKLRRTPTGVFVGLCLDDYLAISVGNDHNRVDPYSSLGTARSVAAGRIAYILGLQGPTLQLDTACSSSLVAVHLACQSLRSGECNLALAGGVNLILSPLSTIGRCKMRAIAPDGRCKTFAATADGYGQGEGCGVVVLKRLSDAQSDGDTILAVIRGSAVNHDGPSSGLTVPNELAQEQLIRQALKNARLKPQDVSYIEAHGTGTVLGDPIEVNALGSVFRQRSNPLLIGSVKSNIGHLEAAAGVACLIKVVLAMQYGEIPPHLHFHKPNPYIDWATLQMKVVTQPTAWPTAQAIAGISSFGLSGTNAHVILEAAPVAKVESAVEETRPAHLLCLSAKTPAALHALTASYAAHLRDSNDNLADICATAYSGRSHFAHRLSVVAATAGEMVAQLQKLAQASVEQHLDQHIDQQPASSAPKAGIGNIAFLFTGQGSQYVEMGQELYQTNSTFRATLDRCDEILRPLLGQSILPILYPEKGADLPPATCHLPLDQTAYTQPALFALEYALAEVWKSWGIMPSVVMGHSVGEYVAACVAGVLSLEDALRLIAKRGEVMQALPQDGAMVAVMADHATVNRAIQPYLQDVSIAAINGAQNIVISGRNAAIEQIVANLQAKSIQTKALAVSHAFHSPLMELLMLDDFACIAQRIRYQKPQIPWISNLTGKVMTNAPSVDYWCQHIRHPVLFQQGIETMSQMGIDAYIEIGPKPTLLGLIRTTLTPSYPLTLPSLRQGRADWQQMLESLGALYAGGALILWAGVEQGVTRKRVGLPTYAFQRERYWFTEKPVNHATAKSQSPTATTPLMELLNRGDVATLAQSLVSTGKLSAEQQQWLPAMLELLVGQQQQQALMNGLQESLYQLVWQTQENHRRSSAAPMGQGKWLLLADLGGVAQQVATALRAQGQQCELVYPLDQQLPATFAQEQVDPGNPNEFVQLLQRHQENLQGILCLWGLDLRDDAGAASDADARFQAQVRHCGNLLHLVQARLRQPSPARLWLITGGLHAVDTQPVCPAAAVLWGMGKTIALEQPELWGGMVDLSAQPTQEEINAWVADLLQPDGETQIAWRNAQRSVARLARAELPPPLKTVTIAADATYLITGGLGKLGLQLADWLVKQGARQLVLTGRRGVSQETAQTIQALQRTGATIHIAQCDVADAQAMRKLFADLQTMPPLRGVIHAASVAGHHPIEQMDAATLEQVLRAKVGGGWLLHQLTQPMCLDFFVLFSSIASLWGSKTQAHYSAANQFLDSLAQQRRQLGLPILSINWGPWAGSLEAEAEAWLQRNGLTSLTARQNLNALTYLLKSEATQLTIATVDWTRFKHLYEVKGKQPLLDRFASATTVIDSAARQTVLRQKLETAHAHDRYTLLVSHLQEQVAGVIGARILPDAAIGFADLGMDSLMAVELKNRLEGTIGQPLPSTLAFNYPNIGLLGNYLLQDVLQLAIVNDRADAPPILAADELLALLAQEVESVR